MSSSEQPPATTTTVVSGVSTSLNRARFSVFTSVPSNTSIRYSAAWSYTEPACITPQLTAASTAANPSVSRPPVPISRIIVTPGSSAGGTAPPEVHALVDRYPQIEVMPATNTANATPETLRQARFGLSRMRRIAIIVAASFG